MNKRFMSFALACVLSTNMLSIPAYASYDGSDADPEGIGGYAEETGGGDDESPGAPASPDAISGTDGIETGDGLEVTWNAVDDGDEDLPLVARFSDVKPGNWFYNDVMKCCQLGIVAGYTDGTFGPNQSVTGAQFVTMMCREFYGNELAKNSADTQFVGRAWFVLALYTGFKSAMLTNTNLYSAIGDDWKSSANTNLKPLRDGPGAQQHHHQQGQERQRHPARRCQVRHQGLQQDSFQVLAGRPELLCTGHHHRHVRRQLLRRQHHDPCPVLHRQHPHARPHQPQHQQQ